MKPESTRPQVTLEQLLRVKRAERPQPEFWQQFEREMRVKQLAAIVEPRPWWAAFIRVGARVARYQVPVGATAIFALTLLTVREYQTPPVSEEQFAPTIVEREVQTMPGPAVAVVVPAPAVAETPVKEIDKTPAVAVAASNAATPTVTPDRALRTMPMLGGAGIENDSPTARMIAANLEAVKNSAPELAQLINRVSGMDALIAPQQKTEVIDPLARVTVNPDRRSSRLLASALPVASYSSGEISTEANTARLSRTLTEERLYDSVSRFGFNANRVAIKF
ncbi:MAG: hypothetical protein H7A44_04540 [Opitutaceae bacterium]|nr:hypothetical protein [Opitutaceae bacterium]